MPVWIGVVVDICHDLPAGRLQARVARAAQSAIFRANHPAVVLPGDGRGAIARSVIHHDHFVIGILQPIERPQTIADRSRPVVSAHHHRHPRPGHLPPEGHFPKRPTHRAQCPLGSPRPVGYPKLPVLHLRAAPIPFIGPGIHKDPGATVGKHRANLPVEDLRLLAFAVAITVQAQLRHHQGPVSGDVVQARQIGIQTFVRFQIHVEGEKIQKRQLQIFRRGIIHIRHQGLPILRLCPLIEPFQKPFQLAPAVPPHDRGRYLVADRVTQQRRVARQRPHLAAHHLIDRSGAFAIIQKRHRTLHRQPRHDAQSLPLRRVQHPTRRRRVGPRGVHPIDCHLRKIPLHHLGRRKLLPFLIGPEGPIRHATHIEFLLPHIDKLPANPRSNQPRRPRRPTARAMDPGPAPRAKIQLSLVVRRCVARD